MSLLFTPPPLILRTDQRWAVEQLKTHLADNPILVLPTGGGKTVTGATLVAELQRPTLWLAHRRELIAQAADRLRSLQLDVGLIAAGHPPYPNRPVQVASVQTLVRRQVGRFGLIVIDECHHTPGSSFQSILAELPGVPRVGLTATPFRLDGKPLGDVFGRIIIGAYADELIAQGLLIEPRVYAPPPASLSGVRIRKGDFETGALARAVDKPQLIGDVVRTWKAHASNMKTVLFAVGVEHSKHLIAAFQAAGVSAEHLDGETPTAQRDASLRRLADGRTLVLSNCQCLTEGWDLPALQCAIIARPTASLCLHLQTVGRIMRACPGKQAAVVLDHAGNFLRHGRVTKRLDYSLTQSVQPSMGEAELAVCPGCERMVLATRTRCPECGAALVPKKVSRGGGERPMPDQVDGELEEFDEVKANALQRQHELLFFQNLRTQAETRGWKRGAVAYRFRERFGRWPALIEYGGTIELAGSDSPQELKDAALEQFEREAAEHQYKPNFARAKFKEVFGHWPRQCMGVPA